MPFQESVQGFGWVGGGGAKRGGGGPGAARICLQGYYSKQALTPP